MPAPDHVTGLAPRSELQRFLDRSLPGPLALVMCDVVGLKEVNERAGFLAGDAMLRRAADRLRAAAPEAAIQARVGGDELAAVFVGPEAAVAAAAAVEELTAVAAPGIRATWSAALPEDDAGRFIERAYAALRRP